MSALGPSPYQSLFDTTIGELCRGDDGCTISEVTTANSDHGDTPFFEAAAVGENCRRSPLWRHKVKNVLHYYELDQSRHSVSKQKR
ncbi:hypothetical protein VTN31DRAFT_4863 [Thermomyces dupontii]|uniref:uncharacterized protein n=1 Tax=Talaromyces thermophilus TaxID=28565 RepID=UPI0037431AA6